MVKVRIVVKFVVLLFIIFLIIVFFRIIKNINKKNNLKYKKDDVVDLEKDPKTDEYKPKE